MVCTSSTRHRSGRLFCVEGFLNWHDDVNLALETPPLFVQLCLTLTQTCLLFGFFSVGRRGRAVKSAAEPCASRRVFWMTRVTAAAAVSTNSFERR